MSARIWLLVLVVPGVLFMGINIYYLVPEWQALDASYTQIKN